MNPDRAKIAKQLCYICAVNKATMLSNKRPICHVCLKELRPDYQRKKYSQEGIKTLK